LNLLQAAMPPIALPHGVLVHCTVDDFLWPWAAATPVLMLHGFALGAQIHGGARSAALVAGALGRRVLRRDHRPLARGLAPRPHRQSRVGNTPTRIPIAAALQQTFADRLPNGRIELVAGVGHGVNRLRPERCARLATEFWRSLQ